jgi:hypothetical protein
VSLLKLRSGEERVEAEVASGADETSVQEMAGVPPTVERFDSRNGGPLRVWAYPNPQHRYVMGVDTAEGLEHGDFSVAQVLDINTGDQVAKWRGRMPRVEFADEVYKLGIWYYSALVGVEANNHGHSVIDRLVQLNYPRLYRRKTINEISERMTIKWGWLTNHQSKALMVDNLDQALRDQAIFIHCRQTLSELRSYIRDEKGKLHGSPHDDDVMSLGIAVQMLKYTHEDDDSFDVVDDYWTVEWWRQRALEEARPKEMPIGYYQRR